MQVLAMVLFVLGLLWGQRALYHKFWDWGLGLRLSFSAKEAFEGERLTLSEELTNAKLLPLPWVTASFQISRNLVFLGQANARVSDDYYQNDMFSIAMYQRVTRRLEFVCARRGYYRIKRMSLSSSNLFLSDRLVRELPCGAELTVFPKLIPPPELEVAFRQILGDIHVRRFTNPDPFAFQGIREYHPADSFRSVNFKATAKTGQLMVNVNSATASQEVVILLNTAPESSWITGDTLEEGVRLAASLAERLLGEGLSVEVRSNGRDAVTGRPLHLLPGSGQRHFHGILRRLARLDLEQEPGPMDVLLEELRQQEPVYLLISSEHGVKLRRAFDNMQSNGLTVRWILPAMADAKLSLEESAEIIRWEVKPYDSLASLHQKAVG